MQLGGAQGCTRWHIGNVCVLRMPIDVLRLYQDMQDVEEVYIYTCIERERERDVYIHLWLNMFIYTHAYVWLNV